MSMIGGFLEIDLRYGGIPYPQAVLLNSGRSCLEYIIRAQKPTMVHIPKFTCAAVLQTLEKVGVAHAFYSIDRRLEIEDDLELGPDELLLYTNYFGIKDRYSRELGERFGRQLILDCATAFYFEPLAQGHTFYSPRKFFGLPDGGLLVTDKRLNEALPDDVSYERMVELLRRIDLGAEADFEVYLRGAVGLAQEPIKRMSRLTHRLMLNIDYEAVRETRLRNFMTLHKHLQATNQLEIDVGQVRGPMAYPYLPTDSDQLRQHLIDHKVLVLMLWDSIFERFPETELEHQLTKQIIHIPVAQNYSVDDMRRIANMIIGHEIG